MAPSHRKQKSPSLIVYVIIAILLAVGLFALYKKFAPTEKAISNDQQFTWETKGQPDARKIDNTTADTEIASKKLRLAAPSNDSSLPGNIDSCQEIGAEINTFLNQLSSQDYIKAYELDESLQDYLNKIIIKLLNNPPIITNESDDMYTILKNSAHFYRILGPKDISLLKDILAYESEGTETIFASLYSWSTQLPPCQNDTLNFKLPLPKLYEYSVFFFNTLGGQSYLFRRESRLRTLIEYYSTLILDRAQKKGLNRYNIDINTTLSSVQSDLKQTGYLIYKNRYIQNLNDIKNNTQD